MERLTVYIKSYELHRYIHGYRLFGFSTPCKVYNMRLRVPKKNIWRIEHISDGSLAYELKQRKETDRLKKTTTEEDPNETV